MFASNVLVSPTYPREVYDRSPPEDDERYLWDVELLRAVQYELDWYKTLEMDVHPASMHNTVLYRCSRCCGNCSR